MVIFHSKLLVYQRVNPIKSHWITIFPWFSCGFPMVFDITRGYSTWPLPSRWPLPSSHKSAAPRDALRPGRSSPASSAASAPGAGGKPWENHGKNHHGTTNPIQKLTQLNICLYIYIDIYIYIYNVSESSTAVETYFPRLTQLNFLKQNLDSP